MRRIPGLVRLFRWPWRTSAQVRADVDAELAFHLEQRTAELVAAGASPEAAVARARREFGDVEGARRALHAADVRHERRVHLADRLAELRHDARVGARALARAPGFALVAVLTLALGIGATTTMFSVVHGVLLAPLPFPDAERLVTPRSARAGTDDDWNVAYRDYLAWRERGIFSSVALFQEVGLDLAGGTEPVHTQTAVVTEDFFATLGVRPLLGRFPRPDEFRVGAERPLVISYALWQRQFGGARDVVGRTVRLTGLPVTIVGVVPPGLEWPRGADAWYPHRGPPDEGTLAPDNFAYAAVARLAPGGTIAAARERLAAVAADAAREFPAKRAGIVVTAVPMLDHAVGPRTTRALWVLLGAVGCVLLIGCVNVANLLLVRAAGRARELAVRASLGASRGRLVRQLLTESVVLALPGGALGVLLAHLGVAAGRAAAPAGMPRLDEVRVDGVALAAAAAVTLGAALLSGLAPALHAAGRRGAAGGLREGGTRTTTGRAGRRTAGALVVTEVALSLMLLAGAGLLGRSLANLWRAETGLDTTRVLTFQLALPQGTYDTRAKALAFWDELRRRLGALPGVRSVAVASALPLGGGGFYLGRTLIRAGDPPPPAGREVEVLWNIVSPDYFRALGQPLLAGRDFTPRDDSAATPVIVVNAAFARAMFGDAAPIGRRVFSWRDERLVREIVGVVGDVRYWSAADSTRPIIYVPLAQDLVTRAAVAVRTAGEPGALAAAARRELRALEPGVAMARVQTMEEVRAASFASQRFSTMLLAAFAALALALAAVGLYGVLSYGVAQRGKELGIRMAMGATRGDVQRLVLGGALRLAAAGVVVGLAGALALTRVIRAFLVGVGPGDPATLGAVTLVLLGVALAAGIVPARRATRASPVAALRTE